jgi:hypothetical protein
LNAFRYKRTHKIKNGNAIKLIFIGSNKKENFKKVNEKLFDKYKKLKIASENIINFKLGFRLNESS